MKKRMKGLTMEKFLDEAMANDLGDYDKEVRQIFNEMV